MALLLETLSLTFAMVGLSVTRSEPMLAVALVKWSGLRRALAHHKLAGMGERPPEPEKVRADTPGASCGVNAFTALNLVYRDASLTRRGAPLRS